MVRTRFAPSPTGYLHIGGVRTALFNWLYARQHGGQFILRIDDTDNQRNVETALQPILEGFRWLGIDWDEGPEVDGPCGPYYQSQRADQYQAAVQSLLQREAAYWDYARSEEIQAERETAQQRQQTYRYSRRWMARDAQQRARFESEGRQGVVRLKMPAEGTLVIADQIRGEVSFDWAREQDHVIQRADGSCLYHLATVVDDHAFGITHVIRAEEHLSNTPRQIFIAQQLGYDLPEYAHIPFVAEPGSKTKISKRKLNKYLKHREFAALVQHGTDIMSQLGKDVEAETFNPVMVDFYRQVGFLPDALLNYFLLLGWSLDDSTEFFSREAMFEHFSLDRVNRAPASFDPAKLMSFQERYERELPKKQKAAQVLPFLQAAEWVTTPPPCDVGPYLQQLVTAAGDRIVVAGDILNLQEFFVPDEQLEYDGKALAKRLGTPEQQELLRGFRAELASAEPFDVDNLESILHLYVEARGIKMGQIIHGIRVAVTGKSVGIGMFDTLALLGRDRCLRRIDRALEQ